MKKILLGFIMLVTAATMNAQMKLEYVLEGYELGVVQDLGSYETPYDAIGLNNIIGLDDFILLKNHAEDTYFFFDAEGELYATLKDMADDTVDSYDMITIAKNVFTTDGKICRLVKAYETRFGGGDAGHTSYDILGIYVIDEDGNTIQKIPFKHDVDVLLVKVAGQYKLLITECYEEWENWEIIDEGHCTYVYSCPGNGSNDSTSVQNVPAKVKRNAYPNPATDLVTLPYDANGATSMKIYDMQGKLVERKFLDKNKQELQLNVKNYTSGMYFFEVNGESNSFIVD